MGKYRPIKKIQNLARLMDQTLSQAESDRLTACPPAEFWLRTAAFLLDGIFLGLLSTSLYKLTLLALVATKLQQSEEYLSTSLLVSFHVAIQTLLIYGYLLRSVSHWGATPGKLLLHLRIVDAETGEHLSFSRTFLREIVGKICGLPVLGFLWPLFRKDERSFHDLISRSTVKKVHGGT